MDLGLAGNGHVENIFFRRDRRRTAPDHLGPGRRLQSQVLTISALLVPLPPTNQGMQRWPAPAVARRTSTPDARATDSRWCAGAERKRVISQCRLRSSNPDFASTV